MKKKFFEKKSEFKCDRILNPEKKFLSDSDASIFKFAQDVSHMLKQIN